MHPLILALLVAAPRPPAIDAAVRQLCEAGSADRDFCKTFTTCGPVRRGTCSGDDRAERQGEDRWSSWRCDVDVRNGYLTCTYKDHETAGPGAGDVLPTTWDAALFVGKSTVLVAITLRGERPQAWFFTKKDSGWSPADPLPKLTPTVFALEEPVPPTQDRGQGPEPAWNFRAEFFVELELPREGTTVRATGRWANTFRDDSGYGQADTQLSSASVDLTWNSAAAKFVVQRSPR